MVLMNSLTRRLSATIFVAVLATVAVFALAISLAWWWNFEKRDEAFVRQFATEIAAEILPSAEAGPDELQRALQRWSRRTRTDLTVLDERGRLIAFAGRRLVRESAPDSPRRMARRPQQAGVIKVALSDGRVLLVRPDPERFRPPGPSYGLPLALLLALATIALIAWPVSRRITRRLEQLQQGVEQQATGDLSARVAVQGRDEVAALAGSFNRSAERIEQLVRRQEDLLTSQKRLLANASHELRSPLARIRMAIELLESQPGDRANLVGEARRNIAELDQLVDEILLASRLETARPVMTEVDLLGLAAEEASRVDAELDSVDGAVPMVTGDLRLLRRLLRNLLENAARYHPADHGEPVRIHLGKDSGQITLSVRDRGPGIPAQAREKIFEAFFRLEGHSEQAGGVGLGLALVRQIAELHGGSVGYEPRVGGGSCFIVRLPAAA